MDRRNFLKIATLAASASVAKASDPLRVVVAGAGIVGAAIAYELAKAGAKVTIIDKEGPASHASRGTFAWINATWAKQPRDYHRLAQDSVKRWHELEEELDIPVTWGGSLEWFSGDERQARLAKQIAEQVEWGEPAAMLDGDAVAALEPRLQLKGAKLAASSPNDGAVDPILATQLLLAGAKALGAELVYPSELLDVQTNANRLVSVETSTGSFAADRLILATGAAQALPLQFAGIDIPQRTTPGVIAITKPMPPLLNGIVAAPGAHMHQRNDGRFVIGEQHGAPASHAERLSGRPNDYPDRTLAAQHGQRLLAAAQEFLPEIADAELESVFIGWRPLPLDGHPVLGTNPERPDIYLAIMHSGVTLAPIVGQMVTQEIMGSELERLAAYRPTRTFESVKRY